MKFIWMIVVFLILEVSVLIGFNYFDIDSNVIAASMTAIVLIMGYFITHDLESSRNSKSRKLELCLDLVKSLRLFLKEPYYNKTDRQKEMRDNFIDSYLSFSIFVSNAAYEKFKRVIEAFQQFLGKSITKEDFQKVQSEFINQLRRELSIKEKIEFETYVIPVTEEELEKCK